MSSNFSPEVPKANAVTTFLMKPRGYGLKLTVAGLIAIVAMLLSATVSPGIQQASAAPSVVAVAVHPNTGQVDSFCDSGTGQVTWNGRDPWSCNGTLYNYRDGSYLGTVNVVQMIASGSPRFEVDLDRWCSDHSFWCTVAVSSFFFIAGFVSSP